VHSGTALKHCDSSGSSSSSSTADARVRHEREHTAVRLALQLELWYSTVNRRVTIILPIEQVLQRLLLLAHL
jgi:hypothetical protein